MAAQTKKTSDFLVCATGGPNNYQGRDMKTTHANLGIKKTNFDDAWTCFEKSLHAVSYTHLDVYKRQIQNRWNYTP